MFSAPLRYMKKSGVISCNKKENTIRFITEEIKDVHKYFDDLKKTSLQILYKCIPEYKNLDIKNIINYELYIKKYISKNSEKKYTEVEVRQYQYIFSRIIKNQDKECVVCKINIPQILEACHIKPYEKCNNIEEKYSEQNGLTMCRNHHKLFDTGFFSFSNNWDLLVNEKRFENFDKSLLDNLLKKYINSIDLKSRKEFNNKYIEFHRTKIFGK